MRLSEYLTETIRGKFDPEKAKSAIEIETAMNEGDFIVTSDTEFDCRHLTDEQCEDLEEAIKQYWDDAGIKWLKLEREGTKFKIYTVRKK